MFGATQVLFCNILKAFNKIFYADLLHKLKFYGLLDQVFDIFSLFLCNSLLRDSCRFPRYPTYLQLHIDDLPDHAFCNIAIYADDTTVYVNVIGF